MSRTPHIEGQCSPAFSAVGDAFAQNFDDGEIGAGLVVMRAGEPLVELWGGWSHLDPDQYWQRNTLVNGYSTGKAVVAMLLLDCAEDQLLDLDAPVAAYWPEFASEGKGAVTIQMLMAHQAGLVALAAPTEDDAIYNFAGISDRLARQAPYWTPGSAHGYHVNTFGYLLGELISRVTGHSVGEALSRRLSGPCQADYYFGVPVAQHRRIAHCFSNADVNPDDLRETQASLIGEPANESEADMITAAYFNPPTMSGIGVVNSTRWRSSEIPSTSGHGTAMGLARLYDAFLHGGRFSGDLTQSAVAIHSDGRDVVLGRDSRFGLGFMLTHPDRPLGPNPGSFGHFGYGGSIGMSDPASGISIGYMMNNPGTRWQNPRTIRILDAVFGAA
ncbi:MAG: beta-lactamase family protein [Acidobacteria bacterium]|nr:beta-lactamase family protein [Acidobacteriota bacterium]